MAKTRARSMNPRLKNIIEEIENVGIWLLYAVILASSIAELIHILQDDHFIPSLQRTF
jgi:hypothetical protein